MNYSAAPAAELGPSCVIATLNLAAVIPAGSFVGFFRMLLHINIMQCVCGARARVGALSLSRADAVVIIMGEAAERLSGEKQPAQHTHTIILQHHLVLCLSP